MPPTATLKNSMMGEVSAASPVIPTRNTINSTIAVPSLSNDSPSIRVPSFLLAPRFFRRDTTATGSVALTTAPNIRAIGQPHPDNPIPAKSSPIASAAVRTMATRMPGIASIEALPTDFLNV